VFIEADGSVTVTPEENDRLQTQVAELEEDLANLDQDAFDTLANEFDALEEANAGLQFEVEFLKEELAALKGVSAPTASS
jgi:regulator of replication initiation timing